MIEDRAAITFPADAGTFGSIVLHGSIDAGVLATATGLTADQDVPLALTADGGC